jgi:hypothetical protein
MNEAATNSINSGIKTQSELEALTNLINYSDKNAKEMVCPIEIFE